MKVRAISLLFVVLSFMCVFSGCMSASTKNSSSNPPRMYAADFDTVFNLSFESIVALKWNVLATDRTMGVITAQTPYALSTPGDKVTIVLTKIEPNITQIDVT